MRPLIDSVLWLAARVPLPCRVRLGVCLGWFLRCVVRLRRDRVIEHLQTAFPDQDAPARNELLVRIYRHFGLLLVELLALPGMASSAVLELCELKGREHLDAAFEQGVGVLVLAGHVGNWELGMAASVCSGYECAVVVKEIKGKAGDYAAQRIRQAHGVQPIPRRDSIRQILTALRKRQGVGFVLDQNMTSDEGVFVEFFGRPACTMGGLAVLSQRSGAPVVPARFYRKEDGRRHCVEFFPAMAWEEVPGGRQACVVHNTQRYSGRIEEFIREHPEQWVWMHRRWRTQPEPEREEP